MSLPQTPPGNGGRRAHVHWCYVSTQCNSNWHAWVAGPCHWYLCHTKGKTKPCLVEMTSGELTCPLCEAGHQCEPIGYQPLYREIDAKPVMAIVHEYTREVVDALLLHKRVTVGRAGEQSDGVYVVPALKADPRYHSTLAERMRPADLTESLLKIWKIPELIEWYRQTHGRTGTPASAHVKPKTAPLKSDGQPFSPWTQKAAEKFTGVEEPAGDGEVFDVLKERLKNKVKGYKPSANGDHKKTE